MPQKQSACENQDQSLGHYTIFYLFKTFQQSGIQSLHSIFHKMDKNHNNEIIRLA